MTKKMMRLLRLLVVTSVVIYVSLSLVRQNYAASIEEEKKKQEEMQKELEIIAEENEDGKDNG